MTVKNNLLLGTRKGLVVYRKNGQNKWTYDRPHFLGIPVTIATIDVNTGTWWALLDHGHWGCKVHRSSDGQTWEEIEAPKYPEGDEVKDGVPAVTKLLWAFSSAGADKSGEILIGTEPGGLFRSKDNGDSFELVRSLWDHPSRKEGWFGGGRDHPAIHSINVDPRDSDHVYVGISCAAVFETKDGGVNWEPRSKGLKADFLPDPSSEIGQDPHLVVMSQTNPDVMWQQNHCGIFKTSNGGELWEDVG